MRDNQEPVGQPSQRAKPAKRAQWAKQRAGFGAAVKIFKAYAAEYFGYRKSTGGPPLAAVDEGLQVTRRAF